MKSRTLGILAALAFFVSKLCAQTDGLYADFTTSLGNFSCSLNYTNAPKTVASFIGLATGEQAWLDLNIGRVRSEPFYSGLTFHRVIKDFVIQTGSPNGQGTDGPGYVFQDEISPTLKHDSAGVLSMANSGGDSNGSQFFVTAAPATFLDGNYTIFGRVVSGLDVVTTINRVATDTSDKPKTNVVIQAIAIRRVGPAATAFDLHAQGLPAVTNPPTQLSLAFTNASLGFSNLFFTDNRLFLSTNLSAWTANALGIDSDHKYTNSLVTNTAAPQKTFLVSEGPDNVQINFAAVGGSEFFRVAQIQYPSTTFTPRSVQNRGLTLNFNGGLGTIVINFDKAAGGTYTFGASNGTVSSYGWLQEAYVGRLSPIYYSGLAPMVLRFNFKATTSGKFTGTAYTASPFSVSGTFALSP